MNPVPARCPAAPEPLRARIRTRDNPRASNGQTWRDRLVQRCLARGSAYRESLRANVRQRRAAVLREIRTETGMDAQVMELSDCGVRQDGPATSKGAKPNVPECVKRRKAYCGDDEGGPWDIREEDIDRVVDELEAALYDEMYLSSQADGDAELLELAGLSQASEVTIADSSFANSSLANSDASDLGAPFCTLGSGSGTPALTNSSIRSSQEEVRCPVCQQSSLSIVFGCVSCECGLLVEGCAEDSLTLDFVRQRLDSVYTEHAASGCSGRPMFVALDEYNLGHKFLHAKCLSCPLSSIVF